jgi:hypothetical protein
MELFSQHIPFLQLPMVESGYADLNISYMFATQKKRLLDDGFWTLIENPFSPD